MLSRGILRLSKRTKSIDSDSKSDRCSTTDSRRSILKDDWSKYDDRLIDCVNKSDINKLKETLKKKGVSPVKVSRIGKTAIHTAVKKRCEEAVELMLIENPDLSCIDMQGRTVYHVAAINGDFVILKKLLDYSKWNLHIKDCKGMIALHYAVQSGAVECVKLLLKSDSPFDLKDNECKTPLLIAIFEKFEEIAAVLIEHGVDVNVADKQGRTPVVIASSLDLKQTVSLLMSKGATLNQDTEKLDSSKLDGGTSETSNGNASSLQNSVNNTLDSSDVFVPVNGHDDDNMDESELAENEDEIDEMEKHYPPSIKKRGQSIPSIQVTHPSASLKRRSMGCKYEDQSLASAIIESLMGFDGSSDNVSEASVTEDQLHLYDKGEQERKELEKTVVQKELCIEKLNAEIDSLRNKVSLERQLRYSAEREVQQLKLEVESLMETNESLPEDTSNGLNDVEDKDTKEETEGNRSGENVEEENAFEETEVIEHEDEENILEEEYVAEEKDLEKYEETGGTDTDDGSGTSNISGRQSYQDSLQVEIDAIDMDNKTDITDKQSDLSVNDDDGSQLTNRTESDNEEENNYLGIYRKESLGTAQNHINVLEERILCLEEELSSKEDQFSEYENEYEKERISFQDQIRSLEEKVEELEQIVEDELDEGELENNSVCSCNHRAKIISEFVRNKNLRKQIEELDLEVHNLRNELSEYGKNFEGTLLCYRNNFLALYQNNLDPRLVEILGRIIQLRAS